MAAKKNTEKSSSKEKTTGREAKDEWIDEAESAKDPRNLPQSTEKTGKRFAIAVLCLFLAVFLVLGLFNTEAVVLKFLQKLVRGFVGWGILLMIPAFLLAAVVLFRRGIGYVGPRLTAVFALPAVLGSLIHIIRPPTIESGVTFFRLIGELYTKGGEPHGGGVIGGLTAIGLEKLFGKTGGILILLGVMILLVLACFRITVTGLSRAVQKRTQTPEPTKDPSEAFVDRMAVRHEQRRETQEQKKQLRQQSSSTAADEFTTRAAEAERKASGAGRRDSGTSDEYMQKIRDSLKEPEPVTLKAEEPGSLPVNEIATEKKRREDSLALLKKARTELHGGTGGQKSGPASDEPINDPDIEREDVFVDMIWSGKTPTTPKSKKNAFANEQAGPTEEPVIPTELQPNDPHESDTDACADPEEPIGPEESFKAEAVASSGENEKEKPQESISQIMPIVEEASDGQYRFPPIALLDESAAETKSGIDETAQNQERLADTLQSFGIEAKIIDHTRGPAVTRYELELDRGVKLSKLTNLADDIALSLGASGVRIAAIPDRVSVVGIEVPNKVIRTVYAREVLDSKEFMNHKSRVAFAVGVNINGDKIVGDISKLPHLLIAGTTGSGKSVCINSLIISLLYRSSPKDVRMIMVDPKMIELGVYNGIPHLLIPVVTDPKKAAGALQWAVNEMMRRYQLLADENARDLESYNAAILKKDPNAETLPKIVIIIDELADLMMAAAKEVEESICRIAQLARAAGMHLIIATQRPSADVITGIMKANVPSRIAFAVASQVESRIILDATGAEKLVGKGDMLYAPLGTGKPQRVQGCFITGEEVEKIVDYIRQTGETSYSSDVMDQVELAAKQTGTTASKPQETPTGDTEESDEMIPAAVEVILETGQASVSMLQRRLKLGYARAARIMDELEERGVVGPFEGSKPRQLLVSREEWESLNAQN